MIQELTKFLSGEYGVMGILFGCFLIILGLVIILAVIWISRRRKSGR